MPFWRLYYHIVWATYNREPLIVPELEQELYSYLTGKVVALESILHAIGGTSDHIHVVVSVPPKVALSAFIGTLKGSSSHHVNHLPGAAGNFGWQDEYGVVSFAERHLPQVIRYVQRQKEHHQTGRLWGLLERVGEETTQPAR
jgi:putative transposase